MSIVCTSCHSERIKKNGHGKRGLQRFLCKQCHSTFSPGAKKKYSSAFKAKVIDVYCHQKCSAKLTVKKFNISTRTLIAWKKEHQPLCYICNPLKN